MCPCDEEGLVISFHPRDSHSCAIGWSISFRGGCLTSATRATGRTLQPYRSSFSPQHFSSTKQILQNIYKNVHILLCNTRTREQRHSIKNHHQNPPPSKQLQLNMKIKVMTRRRRRMLPSWPGERRCTKGGGTGLPGSV